MRRVLRTAAAAAATAVALTASAVTGTAWAGSAQAAPSASESALAAAEARPTTSTAQARAAAGWLGRKFVDGNHLDTTFGGTAYPDAGLTLDAVLALAAAKVGNTKGAAAMNWLASGGQLASYIGNGTTESYAGAHAKVALTLHVRGLDANAFAGRAVLTELVALQQPSGRFTDRSAFGDYSNTFSQSLAIIALMRTHMWLEGQEGAIYLQDEVCPDGGFPETLEAATCTSQVDASAFAAQAFMITQRPGAAHRAARWLATQQAPDGGFGNANSTGLAAAAFTAVGFNVKAAKARAYLASLQQGCTAPVARRGAIGYQPGPFDPATAPRATAQAVLGLSRAGLATVTSAGSISSLPVYSCGGTP